MPTDLLYESLSELETAVLDTLKRFSLEVLRPAGATLDVLPAADVIERNSILWEVHDKYRALGVDDASSDGSLTPVAAARLGALSSEMMGWGDAGLAISVGVASMPARMAEMTGNTELIERFRNTLGCWAVTEPNHGSDVVDFGRVVAAGAEPVRGDCVARREGDHIVINGQKSSWVSNGTIAESAALFTSFENESGVLGGGVFLVPLDVAGVSRGKPTDKVGQRPLNQGEIFFDNVIIPADHMIAGHEAYTPLLEATLTGANGGMGSLFCGLARAALEHAVDYAKDRIQGGKPIIEHQAVRTRLFEMFRKVEAARALNLKVVSYNATETPRLELAIASKVTSTNTAVAVATEAMSIFGGAGITRENPIEKLMRDASVSVIEDGENTLLGLMAAARF